MPLKDILFIYILFIGDAQRYRSNFTDTDVIIIYRKHFDIDIENRYQLVTISIYSIFDTKSMSNNDKQYVFELFKNFLRNNLKKKKIRR